MKDAGQPASLARRTWLIKPYLFWKQVLKLIIVFSPLMFDTCLFCLDLSSPWALFHVSRCPCGLLHVGEVSVFLVFSSWFLFVPQHQLCVRRHLLQVLFYVCPCAGELAQLVPTVWAVCSSHLEFSGTVGFASIGQWELIFHASFYSPGWAAQHSS